MNRNLTDVRGFKVRGAHIGIKSKRRDLALIVSDVPASAAGVFTRNKVRAAPVTLSARHLENGLAQAIVVTSGNANACTGEEGEKAAQAVAEKLAQELGIPVEEVIVAATGVIGVRFPTDKVLKGIEYNVKYLSSRRVYGSMVANAIMTTDTFHKESFQSFKLGGRVVNMAGIAKGAGMIHPNMATMLAFVVTDAAIKPALLKQCMNSVTERTFNMISVDGDTSTNDSAVVMANGMAGNPEIVKKDEDYRVFHDKLEEMCRDLAMAIVSDGEGATKLIEYKVVNARSEQAARKIVRTVSNSNLVRTAMFGRDPNWGRIIAAVGRAGVDLDPSKVDIYLGASDPVQVSERGGVADFDMKKLRRILRSARVNVLIDLHQGNSEAVGWGTDMSYEYIRINAEYTS